MDISNHADQLLINSNRSWNGADIILAGLSITLLVADFVLLGLFEYKIFFKRNKQIFGKKAITSILDKVIIFTLFLLILQSIASLNMVLISKSVTNGLTCSVYSAVFHILNSLLKLLTFYIVFFHYYIWMKQRCLRFLHPSGVLHTLFKFSPLVVVLSFSIVLSFEIKFLISFVIVDGICYGEVLSFKKSFFSCTVAYLVVFLIFIIVQLYHLFRTIQEEFKQPSNKKSKTAFAIIRRQLYLFLKLQIAVAVLLALFLVETKVFYSDGMIKFADFNYFARHLYNFVFCSMLCIFRCTAPTLDIKSELLIIRKKNSAKSLTVSKDDKKFSN